MGPQNVDQRSEEDAEELGRLLQEIVVKRRGKLTCGILLLQDNAPANIP